MLQNPQNHAIIVQIT